MRHWAHVWSAVFAGIVLGAASVVIWPPKPVAVALPGRCPEYAGTVVTHQRTTAATGELNCVYVPVPGRK